MNTVAISQIGGALAGGGNNTGIPAGAGNAPSDVSGISVTGVYDPIAREIFLTVTFTAPTGTGEPWTGVHPYLDIPDHGDGSNTAVVGAGGAGQAVDSAIVQGPFNPIDLGVQTNPQQPWYLSCPFPGNLGLQVGQDIAARLYLPSASVVRSNQLVQFGQPGATPSAAFTLVCLTSGTPSAGTNVTANCGNITCEDLPADTSTGKSMTPFVALMGSVPANPPKGWGYRLYLYTGNSTPAGVNDPAITPLTDVCTVAGVVPQAKSDLVTGVLNSFAIQTPKASTTAVVYAVAGLMDSSGKFNANNIVPGITNSCLIELDGSAGTIDAAAMMASSISSEISIILGKFGLTPSSVGAGFLAPGAAQTNLGVVAATTIISANTITGSLLATTGIITSSAQIGLAVVADANIGSLNVSKLQAGTATFSGTAVFQNTSGPAVTITSTQVAVTGGAYTIGVNSSSGISVNSSTASLAISTNISLSAGSNSLVISSSQITLTNTANSTTTTLENQTVNGLAAGLVVSSSGFVTASTAQGLYSTFGSGFASVGCVSSGGGVSLASASSGDTINLSFGGGSSPQLDINGSQVVGPRQTGPGSAPASYSQTWCNDLLTALQNHGLVS